MKLATTTYDFWQYFQNERNISYTLPYFAQTPFRHLDMNFTQVQYPDSPWYDECDLWKKEVEDCAECAMSLGLDFVQAHAPFLPYTDYFNENTRPSYMRAIHHSIEACAMLGIPHITIHGVFRNTDTAVDFFQENLCFCRELGETAEKFGVDILIENFQSGDYGYYLRTGRELRQFIDMAGIPRLHACWDTGHGNMHGRNQYPDIIELGSHLRALHIHDNWGTEDSHVMPFVGNANFDQILRGLTEIGYTGSFCFEASDTFCCRSDRRLAPTPFLQQKLETVMYEIGKWMLHAYDVFEE